MVAPRSIRCAVPVALALLQAFFGPGEGMRARPAQETFVEGAYQPQVMEGRQEDKVLKRAAAASKDRVADKSDFNASPSPAVSAGVLEVLASSEEATPAIMLTTLNSSAGKRTKSLEDGLPLCALKDEAASRLRCSSSCRCHWYQQCFTEEYAEHGLCDVSMLMHFIASLNSIIVMVVVLLVLRNHLKKADELEEVKEATRQMAAYAKGDTFKAFLAAGGRGDGHMKRGG